MRGVDEKTIRNAIESGILKAALREDGLLDVAAADAALSAAKIGGERVASNLVKARARKIGAAVALLSDEVAALEAGVAPAAEAAATVRQVALHMCRVIWPLAALVPRLAGLQRADAIAAIDGEVRDRLTMLAQTKVAASRPKSPRAKDGPTLSEMSPVDLAAERATLQARKLEIERGLNLGELVDLAPVQAAAVDGVMRTRGKLLAMPTKLGAHIGDTVDAVELKPVLEAEVLEALAELAGPAVSIADIKSARDQAEPGSPLVFKLHHHERRAT